MCVQRPTIDDGRAGGGGDQQRPPNRQRGEQPRATQFNGNAFNFRKIFLRHETLR